MQRREGKRSVFRPPTHTTHVARQQPLGRALDVMVDINASQAAVKSQAAKSPGEQAKTVIPAEPESPRSLSSNRDGLGCDIQRWTAVIGYRPSAMIGGVTAMGLVGKGSRAAGQQGRGEAW